MHEDEGFRHDQRGVSPSQKKFDGTAPGESSTLADWWADVLKAVVGAGLGSGAVTLWLDRRKRKADGTYLAMRLAVILEAYAEACADLIIANQNATHRREEQFPDWDIHLPNLPDYPEDSDGWRALNANMASESLHLRSRINSSQSLIGEVADVDDEGLQDAVRDQASALGLDAWNLAGRLRKANRLPSITPAFGYPERLKREKARGDAEAAARGRE